jgi:hypothetical protein
MDLGQKLGVGLGVPAALIVLAVGGYVAFNFFTCKTHPKSGSYRNFAKESLQATDASGGKRKTRRHRR